MASVADKLPKWFRPRVRRALRETAQRRMALAEQAHPARSSSMACQSNTV